MKESCTDFLRKAHVPKTSSPENFSLEKYMHKDNSIEKEKAAARAKGDYAKLIRLNNIDKLASFVPETKKGRPRVEMSEAGMRIIRLCHFKGITAGTLAKEIGVSPNTITSATRKDGKCTYRVYKQIADYFRVSVDWIITGKE